MLLLAKNGIHHFPVEIFQFLANMLEIILFLRYGRNIISYNITLEFITTD